MSISSLVQARLGRAARSLAAAALLAGAASALAGTIPPNFQEYGTPVAGYQDQFNGTSLASGWTPVGTNVYTVSGGYLHIGAPSTDPTKLLYQGAPYDGIQQNVLVLGKIISASGTDCRMGATASNTAAGNGVNVMFRGNDTLDNVAFLDDFIVHGPQNNYAWSLDTWYWIRILHSPNRTGGTDPAFNGSNDVFGKVWPADGTTPEPANYQFTWNSNDSRSGFAGIQAGVGYGASQWDVGYVLIQAAGLPTITAGPPGPVTPPEAPTNLVAGYTSGLGVSLSWTDNSKDEAAFQVERAPEGYSFALLASTAADATSATDTSLYPATKYTYRVRAVNANGNSAYSNEASITTANDEPIPAPPPAPSPLSATPLGAGAIALSWTDRSPDETRYDLVRAEGGESFASFAVLKADVTGFADYSLHPGWPYTYRIRALSLQGPSPFSNNAAAAVPSTLAVTVTAGALTDSPKFNKDKISLTASYAKQPANPEAVIDPVRDGVELQIGSSGSPVSISVAAGDKTWKVKKTKATWKSPKGALPKVAIVVDTAKKVLSVSVSSFTFDGTPSTNSRTLFAVGLDGGLQLTTWTVKKPGVLYFK